jgi:segregation and condensation protein B
MEEPRETSDGAEEATAATPVAEPPESSGDADSEARLGRILESVLFASGAPLSLKRLVELLGGPSAKEVQAALSRVRADYAPGRRGIQLHEVAGGYQFRTARENAPWVRAAFREKPARLGRATLETLAVVAYKQPVTKAEIEAIRGVDVDGTLATLMTRRLVKIAGRKETVGRPLLYATTAEFLEVFQLKNLEDLPSLKELGPAPEAESYDSQPIHETAASEVASDEADTSDAPQQTTSREASADSGDEGALAEDSQPSRDRLTASGGGVDPQRAGPPERKSGDGAGNEGGSAQGSDHD